MQRWKITIEYDGTGFFGWQRQESTTRTVQGTLEAAIKEFSLQDVTLHVAGRTDAGVHAHGQVAHFDLEEKSRGLTPFKMMRAINAGLIETGVSVINAEKVDTDFHARFSAKKKHYRYRVVVRTAPPVLNVNTVWHRYKKLDLAKMCEGRDYLLGYHDFTSFRATECQAKSPMRSVERLDITELEYDRFGGAEFIFDIEARSFLHHQVRNMVGSLVKVGDGHWEPQKIQDILAAKARKEAGQTAPATGLSLIQVFY